MRFRLLLVAFVLMLAAMADDAFAADQLHYVDTLRGAREQAFIKKAIREAPSVFVYQDIRWGKTDDGYDSVSFTRIKFNESMRAVNQQNAFADDPLLQKKCKRLYNLLRPLGVTLDLVMEWKEYSGRYIITRYHINNVRMWGRKASSSEVSIVN